VCYTVLFDAGANYIATSINVAGAGFTADVTGTNTTALGALVVVEEGTIVTATCITNYYEAAVHGDSEIKRECTGPNQWTGDGTCECELT